MELASDCCLLHISTYPLEKYKHSLKKHLLNTAKSLSYNIEHGSPTCIQSIRDWLHKVNTIYDMEEAQLTPRLQLTNFIKPGLHGSCLHIQMTTMHWCAVKIGHWHFTKKPVVLINDSSFIFYLIAVEFGKWYSYNVFFTLFPSLFSIYIFYLS